MVTTPNLKTLPFELHNGIKYFELTAEPIEQEILPGLFIKGWGYNGSIPGPTIQVEPDDQVVIRVINYLPEPTSIHWHGLDIPNVMDGVPDIEPSPLIGPGQYFDYRFRIVNPPGTHMYHTHVDSSKQQMLGLGGAFIILDPEEKACGDYFYMLQEFNLIGLQGGNPIHITNRLIKNTVDVASGETYDIEFYADNPGIWPFHCHIPHHMSNNMTKPMGGMTTTIVYER